MGFLRDLFLGIQDPHGPSQDFKGIPDFKPYRTRLVTSDASADVFATLDEIEHEFDSMVSTL